MGMSEYYEKYLYGNSICFSKESEIEGIFDIFIFSVGWEDRCINITDHIGNEFLFSEAVILKFSDEGIGIKEAEYDDYIKQFLDVKKVRKIKDILFDTVDPTEEFILKFGSQGGSECKGIGELFSFIESIHRMKERPLNIGFDISSCPRVVFLQFLHYCIVNDITETLSFFYSEGDYGSNINQENDEFTSGLWEVNTIPGYGGKNINIQKKDYFVVSFGFDQKSYTGWVDECESLIKVGVLLPVPGYDIEYDDIVKKKLRYFKEKLSLDENNDIGNTNYLSECATAGDAIEAWQKLDLFLLDNIESNMTFLPYGPKPHSLAMGLKCLLNDNLILTYRTSTRGYNKINVKALGKVWRYDIKNLVLI